LDHYFQNHILSLEAVSHVLKQQPCLYLILIRFVFLALNNLFRSFKEKLLPVLVFQASFLEQPHQ
jgi:hypothetical protein